MSLVKNILKELSDLGQGGVSSLSDLEKAWAAHKANPTTETELDVDLALKALHDYGAHSYRELGLKLRSPDKFTGAAGEVLLVGGSGGKDDNTPPGNGGA